MKPSQKIKQNVVNQIAKTTLYENVSELMKMQQIYEAGIKEIRTKLEILDAEFKVKHDHNPIHHIESRLKSPESILKKAISKDIPVTERSLEENIHDIAGIRVICSFTSDIYRIAEMISNQSDIKIISIKDYIKHPKESGYKSYHMLVSVPIFLSDRNVNAKVEIQIRTVAMDFWASLEHKIHYKFEGNAPEHIKTELVECARMVSDLDARMLSLNEEVQALEGNEEV